MAGYSQNSFEASVGALNWAFCTRSIRLRQGAQYALIITETSSIAYFVS